MRTVVVFLLAASINASAAGSFDDRVSRAEALEHTPAGQAYQDQMWPLVQPFFLDVLDKCLRSHPAESSGSFVWVATLTSNGELTEVETRPESDVSKCFSEGMAHAPFPKPPAEFSATGLLLTFQVNLHVVSNP